MTPHKTLSKKEVQKEIVLSNLKNLYTRMSAKRKIDVLQKALGSTIWSNLALSMNLKIVDKVEYKKNNNLKN